jgi:hypothetical protein
MSDEIKAHAELLDDGSYHCLVQWSSTVDCNRIEWSEDEIVEHLRDDHHLTDEQIVFTGRPEPIVHRGALYSRVETLDCNYHNCLREKAFADEWEREQQERQILAHLAIVPAAPDDPHSWKPMYALDSKTRVKRAWAEIDEARELTTGELYSQRDATVAATVIQWLGTNVGFCWLEETLKKAGYSVEREEQRAQEIAARLKALEERDASRMLVTVVEQILAQRVGEIGLAALRFATAHCSSEAELFERFQQQLVIHKSNRRETFSISTTEGPNGLRTIANTLRDVFGALVELQGALDLRKRQAALTQPDASIAPQTSGQTSPASP